MGVEGGDWVEPGLGLEPLSRNVNLVLSPVDEICCHHLLFPSVLGEIVHKAQANVALQSVAIGTAGGLASIQPVSVNGLSPPRPEVQVCVVVVQDEHSQAFVHPILPLLQQGISTNEIHPLGKKGNTESSRVAQWTGPLSHRGVQRSPRPRAGFGDVFAHPVKHCIYNIRDAFREFL